MIVGSRVEIPTHYDSWMMGDRFGVIVKMTRTHTHVRMDRSGRTLRIPHGDMCEYGKRIG